MIGLVMLASAVSLNCEVQPPQSVQFSGQQVRVPRGESTDVALNWPGDPIRAGKAMAALSIGPHDYAFLSLHPGPCLFTPTACMFMYTLSQQEDGTADILIQPAALATKGDRSRPFQVFLKGRCTPAVPAERR